MILYILIFYLLICSIVDVKEKKIPVYLLYIGICLSSFYFIFQFYTEERQISDLIISLIPGVSLILICKVSKDAIGMADALIFIITGLILTPYRSLLMMIIAFFLSFLFSCVLIIIKKAKKNARIPFIPFILFSTIIQGYIEI